MFTDEVKQKLQTIDEIKPKDKEFNDFIPLLRASEIQLNSMKNKAFKERLTVDGEHRLYYISDRLKVRLRQPTHYYCYLTAR